ncbi:hypothetical protein [Bdellovibrio bacteriovorus]|uniref:hypothetical protein n=1 Tax=Bdellovibrio TaxID=958 RepID=UPI0035A975A6
MVRPYNQESLPFFRQLSVEEQLRSVTNLQNYISICHTVHQEGGKLEDASLFVRKALQFYGYKYDEAPLKDLADEYLTEFYSLSTHIQLFRTISYFEYASYTIEDIYSRPWIHLYDRDPVVSEKLVNLLMPFTQGSKETVYVDVQEHLLIEKASLERLAVNVKVLYIVPLLKEDKTDAYLVVARCHPLLET